MGATEETTYVRKLPCRLTPEELEQRIHEAAEKVETIELIDGELGALKSEMKAKKAERDTAQARVNELANIAEAGEETRDVVCHHVFDLPTNTVWLKRVDNDAVVEERAMTADEREEHGQLVLAAGDRDEEEVPS